MDLATSKPSESSFSLRARDIMTRAPATLTPDTSLFTAARLIGKSGLEGAPVVDDDGALVGVVTEKDCITGLTKTLADRLPLPRVADVMTRDVFSIDENVSFLTIAHIFTHQPYRYLPVVRGGVAIGYVGRREFLNSMTDALQHQPDYTASTLYLSAVARPALALV